MNRHSFSLSSIGMTKGRAQVKLDGEDISDAVNGIGLDFTARETPRVMLELAGVSADVAVDDAEIQLPQKVVELLGRLGWVPGDVYRELRDVAECVVTGEAAVDSMREVLVDQGWAPDVPTSDDAPGDNAAGGVGPVIT